MKKLQTWFSKNWQYLMLLAVVGWLIYNFLVPTPGDAILKRVEAANDSLISLNASIQAERDSIHELFKIDSIKVEVALKAVDSLEAIKPLNKLEYEKAYHAIYNSTDTGFIRYLSEFEIPVDYME